jgi:hypothetical protein
MCVCVCVCACIEKWCADEVATHFVERRTRLKCIMQKNDDKTRAIVILTCV